MDAYYGQTGTHIFHDPADDALGLPTGDYDVPLMFTDKIYNSTGDLVSPESERVNWFGDILQVNNQPWPYFNVEPRRYRFRFLDIGLSRPYEISFQDAAGDTPEFVVIGSDGGLFPNPVNTSSVVLATGERYEIVFDFTPYASTNVTMMNIYYDAEIEAPLYVNTDQLMRFVVGSTVTNSSNNDAVPTTLAGITYDLPPNRTIVDHVFGFQRNSENWTINGVTFDDVNARTLARPPAGTVERWTLTYESGPGVHPVHLHLVEFQVLSRTGGRSLLPYESAGMKDVVLLEPGESVDVLAKYGPWNGLYQFHCHNLIHEDHEMMDAFNVTALTALGYDDVFAFDDPLDTRYSAQAIDPYYYTADYILETLLPAFVNSSAYSKMAEVVAAEDAYYLVNPYGESATSTVAVSTSYSYGNGYSGSSYGYGGASKATYTAVSPYTKTAWSNQAAYTSAVAAEWSGQAAHSAPTAAAFSASAIAAQVSHRAATYSDSQNLGTSHGRVYGRWNRLFM